MADNENNNDSKPLQDPSQNESDFWEINQSTADTDLDSIDLEEIQDELNKEINITPIAKPITNLSDSELEIKAIDEQDVISTLDSEQARAELASEHGLTDEELDTFREDPAPVAVVSDKKKSTPLEKIMVPLCFLGLIGFAVFFISYLNDKFDVKQDHDWASNIPAKGKYVSIDRVDTWWTVPQSNNTKFGVKLVPAVTITLGSDSKSGTLRAVFYSYEEGINGEPRAKGDPFPLPFVDGKFVATGKNQVTLYGTDGYKDLSSFEYYRTQNEDRWTISIREAASGETNANKFNEVGHAPIEPIRIGTEKKAEPKTVSE